MSINLGSNSFGLYLGSTKISEAYIGNVKVLSSGLPAKTMRYRFADPTYDPTVPLQSEADTWYKGTWTKVTSSSYNDWDWHYDDPNWAYGPYVSNAYADADEPHLNSIEYDIIALNTTGITNFARLFCGSNKLKNIYGEIDLSSYTGSYGDTLFTSCESLETLPLNISSINSVNKYIRCIGLNSLKNIKVLEGLKIFSATLFYPYASNKPYNTSCNGSSVLFKRSFNKNSDNRINILKYYIDNNTTCELGVLDLSSLFENCNLNGKASDYIPNTNLVTSSTTPGLRSTFACSTIEQGYTLSDIPTYITGTWQGSFAGCFNLTNITETYQAMSSFVSSANMYKSFNLAGMNSSSGRSQLAALTSSYGGGTVQDFRDIASPTYLPRYIPGITNLDTSNKESFGVTFFFPRSMRGTGNVTVNFHYPKSSTTLNRSDFLGHGKYSGKTAENYKSSVLNVKFGIFQFDNNGDIKWKKESNNTLASISSGSSTRSITRSYTSGTNRTISTGSSYASSFDENQVVMMGFIGYLANETYPDKDYFILKIASSEVQAGSTYGWFKTTYPMFELADITAITYMDD